VNRFSRKVKRLSRQLGVKPTVDPDGVIAVLQVARRLVKDTGAGVVEALLDAADRFAAPKDPVIAFWTAHYAYSSSKSGDAVGALEDAADRQGRMNQFMKKGPK
jgi:hypothetical protein